MAEYKPLTDKEYQQLQKLYERALADEHAQLTARMRDDLLRRREDLRLEELAATRADPRLNYAERMHEAYRRGHKYDLPYAGDRLRDRSKGYTRRTGNQAVPGVPESSGWQSMDQERAELYGPLADNFSIPWGTSPRPPAPGRYSEEEIAYLAPQHYDYGPETDKLHPPPMEFPEYYGPSPYPREATQRERFMDMLKAYMRGSGQQFPVPSQSRANKRYYDRMYDEKEVK
tara:strand:- start:116 stop:805 length:690 start_codon:yes stop_codon:yes gene_type:complete